METKLARISQLSKENPDMVFTSLGHLLNKEMLKSCHAQMDGTKAVGIDGITKEEYGRSLEENINALMERLKKKSYKPKPAKLVEIPKDNGKMRPLSIYCYEDKLVQEALRRILEAVFEPIFYDEMMGFRPNRGCHKGNTPGSDPIKTAGCSVRWKAAVQANTGNSGKIMRHSEKSLCSS